MKLLTFPPCISNHINQCFRRFVAAVFILTINSSFASRAFAQQGSALKWDQPPAPATNVFYGWNQEAWYEWFQTADDWVCTNSEPVTKIRWWGSFIGWAQPGVPPQLPAGWRIQIWTDVALGAPGNGVSFSHPGQVVHEIFTNAIQFTCVGVDYHPHDAPCQGKTGQPIEVETCYMWEMDLSPEQYFYQQGPYNIYWISISAVYTEPMPEVLYPFGMKTRPRNPNSLAPDAAVLTTSPLAPVLGSIWAGGFPLYCSEPWDLAFELFTGQGGGGPAYKWEQLPDLSTNGIDVRATFDPQQTPAFLLADDFLCTQIGYITNICIWGSWFQDRLPHNLQGIRSPTNVVFTLSLHEDVPDPDFTGPGFSRPTNAIWSGTFYPGTGPGTFTTSLEAGGIREGFMSPPTSLIPAAAPGDTNCWKYEFTIPQGQVLQQGTLALPKVYWLDVQATFLYTQTNTPPNRPMFGWKTSTNHWNDDAVWAQNVIEPVPAGFTNWNELRYPPGHPKQAQSIDLAFRINGGGSIGGERTKWSQPPVPLQNPTNVFNGWNEPSIYQGGVWTFGFITNIVADDWLCTDSRAISDIHWWGSFLQWRGTNLPPLQPSGFHIAIWKDVAAGVNTAFSHPDNVEKEYYVSLTDPNFTGNWVGWDVDPRGSCPEIESCFKFDYYIQDTNNWFYQQGPSNVYWLSISAIYPGGNLGPNPFGWKTRPHVPVPPDDSVRIFNPLSPVFGSTYISGEPIEFPSGTSWDMAFQLTTCQQLPQTNLVITNINVVAFGANQIINIGWISKTNYIYQVQQAGVITNSAFMVWTNIGAYIVGPNSQIAITNTAALFQRYYRIALPNLCP